MPPKNTTVERVSVLETKVDDLRSDIVEMRQENKADHAIVIKKLENLQDLKNYVFGACAVIGVILAYIATVIDWHTLLNNAIK